MKKNRKKIDLLVTGLVLVFVGIMFLSLNSNLNLYIIRHFVTMNLCEGAILCVMGLLVLYKQKIESVPDDKLVDINGKPKDRAKAISEGIDLAMTLIILIPLTGILVLIIARLRRGFNIPEMYHMVICVLVFIIYACIETLWRTKLDRNSNAAGICNMMVVNKVAVIVLTVDLVFYFFDIEFNHKIFDGVIIALCVFVMLSIEAVALIRTVFHKGDRQFNLAIPLPFYKDIGETENLVDWLATNTGITMRSLWSLKFLRVSIPTFFLSIIIFAWLSTCIVEIDSYQRGALYHFGRLDESTILEPGLHFKLPVPFDVVKVHDITHPRTVFVGYEGHEDDSDNNLWTMEHSGEEHKMLLGNGRELVSVNLKIIYRINDLYDYLSNYSDPEQVLQAKCYELLMQETISSDINTVMGVDRAALSDSLSRQLTEFSEDNKLGIEIIEVALASIHPPIEIADVYQSVVSASIQKNVYHLKAQGDCMTLMEQANAEKQVTVNTAGINYDERTSVANAEVIEYNADIAAYHKDPAAYELERYIEAVSNVMKDRQKYLLGEGVDAGSIYMGFPKGTEAQAVVSGNAE